MKHYSYLSNNVQWKVNAVQCDLFRQSECTQLQLEGHSCVQLCSVWCVLEAGRVGRHTRKQAHAPGSAWCWLPCRVAGSCPSRAPSTRRPRRPASGRTSSRSGALRATSTLCKCVALSQPKHSEQFALTDVVLAVRHADGPVPKGRQVKSSYDNSYEEYF